MPKDVATSQRPKLKAYQPGECIGCQAPISVGDTVIRHPNGGLICQRCITPFPLRYGAQSAAPHTQLPSLCSCLEGGALHSHAPASDATPQDDPPPF